MKISFNNITPAPLAGVIDLHTQIWEKKLLFEKGKKYKIFAPSGKGKSTFIHIIYGLRNDYQGQVLFDEREISSIRKNEWADLRQQKLSVVFQDLRLFLDLKAIDNIHVKSVLYGEDQSQKIIEMAKHLGVDHLFEKTTRTMSYGERQRIAIIRALVQPFDWIFLDEPFSHLDKKNIQKVSELISNEVNKRGAGMMVTSLGHDDFFDYTDELQL